MLPQQAIVVLTNVPDIAVAQAIAGKIVAKRLAACVNILPAVQSIYRWQGKLESASEVTLLIKTRQALYQALQTEIQTLHPYDVPEIICMAIADGLPAYLDWIALETQRDANVSD